MEDANFFISRLKANGSAKDLCNMEEVLDEYKVILDVIPSNNTGMFSLNVLCILCRNIDKIPSWCDRVNTKDLLTLAIDCVRETRCLDKSDQVKTLACIYKIHKLVVRKYQNIPPELIIKLSYMAFERDQLSKEHYMAYWCILIDRLTYMGSLKTENRAIVSLLPKLTKDLEKLITIFDTVQFCTNNLIFLLKKLYFLYGDKYSKQLNEGFVEIFEELIAKNDLKSFRELTEKEAIDLYVKFIQCINVVAENSLKLNFENTALNIVVRTCISFLGYFTDIYHCLQTFYLNSVCFILTNNPEIAYTETVLDNLLRSCETTEKLGYNIAMYATYPHLHQLLRIYMEYVASKPENMKLKDNTNNKMQENCLKLMILFMKKSKHIVQESKCDGCYVKSAMHDVLKSSFSTRALITTSLSQDIDITNILPTYFELIDVQYIILSELKRYGCINYDKYFLKIQTDIHNTAILLYKVKFYKFSLKLFDIYIRKEIENFKNDSNMKNIGRAFYNRGVCSLDAKLHDCITDAYLALIFSLPEALNTDKYMSLVISTKSAALKNTQADTESVEEFDVIYQSFTSLHICNAAIQNNEYGLTKSFFSKLKFSEILKHEFLMYSKFWPSLLPIAGVWTSLYDLIDKKHSGWLEAEMEGVLLSTLLDIILETPTTVRSMHNDDFANVIYEILDKFFKPANTTLDCKILQATLMFLKTEFKLNEASKQYNWKINDKITDPDAIEVTRTVWQESEAISDALNAVLIWAKIIERVKISPPSPNLHRVLHITQVFVPQLLHLQRLTDALQLAHICCELAQKVGDSEAFIRNAGTIFYHAQAPNEELNRLLTVTIREWNSMPNCTDCLDTMVVSFCDVAIYHTKIGSNAVAAKLVQKAQSMLLDAYQKKLDVNLDLATGRLMEAQYKLCKDSDLSTLSAVIGIERHYLHANSNATKWSVHRLYTLTTRYHIGTSSVASCALARSLQAWRRARMWASACFPVSGALTLATLYCLFTHTHRPADALTKIKYGIKYILHTEYKEDQKYTESNPKKDNNHNFVPKHENLEIMLECQTSKKDPTSPCLPSTVLAYKTPEFLTHQAKCWCYACETPIYAILALQTFGLEASSYFRSKEVEIAKNYYEGILKDFEKYEAKLKHFLKYRENDFDKYILDIVKDIYEDKLKEVQLEVLLEATFFELSEKNNRNADEYIVRIHEIVEEMKDIDLYLKNEIMNLMAASAHLKKATKKPEEIGLEADLENLKLSPGTKFEVNEPKTPMNITKPPICTPKVVNQEEIPHLKCKVIKFNLDEVSEETERETKTDVVKSEFKMPIPKISKAVPEIITPGSVRKTKIGQESSEEPAPIPNKFDTPIQRLDKTEFFTPLETPGDQFFTPMITKTYTKRTTRTNIVKNLETEFSTPKADNKENTDMSNLAQNSEGSKIKSTRTKLENKLAGRNYLQVPSNSSNQESRNKSNRLLKRTTSPGKLNKDTLNESRIQTRSRRLRNFKLSIDEDEKR